MISPDLRIDQSLRFKITQRALNDLLAERKVAHQLANGRKTIALLRRHRDGP
jgi:hypothetical protein